MVRQVVRTIFKNVFFSLLLCASFAADANNVSTRIGISVEIKSTQACDYTYVMETNLDMFKVKRSDNSSCGITMKTLQKRVNHITSSELTQIQFQQEKNRFRVFMTVQ